MTKKQQSNQQYSDLNAFKYEAIETIYQGKPITGKDGIFTDMVKEILENRFG